MKASVLVEFNRSSPSFRCIGWGGWGEGGRGGARKAQPRQSLFSGMDYWNGLLEWTTGMPFDLKFSHKNPLLANGGVGMNDYITI